MMIGGLPFSWDSFGRGVFGLLIDRESGLLIWAPIYVLLPAAWALSGRGSLMWLLPVSALFFLSADIFNGGAGSAGRTLSLALIRSSPAFWWKH